MSLDDGPGAHRREVQAQQARGHHVPTTRRTPWVDPEAEADRALEGLYEDLAAVEHEAALLRHRIETVTQWRPEPETARTDRDLPGYDPREFGAGDTDRGVA